MFGTFNKLGVCQTSKKRREAIIWKKKDLLIWSCQQKVDTKKELFEA